MPNETSESSNDYLLSIKNKRDMNLCKQLELVEESPYKEKWPKPQEKL